VGQVKGEKFECKKKQRKKIEMTKKEFETGEKERMKRIKRILQHACYC
jgi:hypothetical protein